MVQGPRGAARRSRKPDFAAPVMTYAAKPPHRGRAGGGASLTGRGRAPNRGGMTRTAQTLANRYYPLP